MKKFYLKAKSVNGLLWSFIFFLTSAMPIIVNGQAVLQTESFESAVAGASAIFPSPGWRQQKFATNINGAFVLQPFLTATNPAPGASPGGGANLLMFNSFVANNNDTSIMITKPFDFSNNGGVNPFLRFYMYRDNGLTANDDKIRIYINTTPSIIGATLLTNTLGTTDIFRKSTGVPAAAANTWNQYTYDLPAAVYNGRRYYFIIMGIGRDGNNIYLDQVQVSTHPSPTLAADVKMNLFLQNLASAGVGQQRQMVVGIRCVVGGNSGCGYIDNASAALTTACKLDSILMNTNGTSNLLDIANARIYYTGGSNLFDTSYVSPFPALAGVRRYPTRQFGQTIATPQTNIDFGSAATSCYYLEYDTTYFWLTYDVRPTATGGNFIDGDFREYYVGGTNASCPSTAGTYTVATPDPGGFSLPGASQIDLPYCVGTYTLGTSWQNGSYTNNDYIQSVVMTGANGTAINTNVQGGMPYPSNNNGGLPSGLPCFPACDFTAHPVNYELWQAVPLRTVVLTQGLSYTITVQAGTWFSSNNIAVWIDFNRNGVFDDPSERLGGNSPNPGGIGNAGFQVSLLANASAGISFTMPVTGYTGPTRMRVREVFAATNLQPCAQYTWGEIEDFQIILAPPCPVGYKLWLGNTDEWNNPGNWCGGVPAITDDAVLNRVQVFPPTGTPTRRYFPATIKSNVPANCNNLTISTLDTVLINAPIPSANALKIRRDITNNGRVKVISSLPTGTSVTYSTGTLNFINVTPFRAAASDARMQIIYQATELAAFGLVAGDQISSIRFNITSKSSTGSYNSFTIGYALVANGTQFATNAPNAAALTTVYGPLAYTTAAGLNTINLTTPIIWDGSSNILIQYCFDNSGTVGNLNDVILSTQTTGINSILLLSNTTGATAGCGLTMAVAGTSDNFWSATRSVRPNFTFLINRPYSKAIIRVQEDWINNNAFEAGYSLVVFDSTVANTIGGTQNTTFNELEVNKGAATQTVTMLRPVTLDTSLVLTQGILAMNTNTLTMNNPALSGGTILAPTGPFVRTNGFLVSESSTASVIWRNPNTIGWRNIPFGHSLTSTVYIPYSFTLKSGTLGDFSVATAYWPGNAPLPAGVTHINNTAGAGNAAGTVDRFWNISHTGSNPVVDLTFRYSNAAAPATERAGASPLSLSQPKAQPWWNYLTNRAWIRLQPPTIASNFNTSTTAGTIGTFDSVRVQNFNWPNINPQAAQASPFLYATPGGPMGTSNIWTISNLATPLPIELINFDAKAIGSRVRLNWSTASEVNNDFFTVERSGASNPDEFDFIAKVNSYMNNSNVTLNYETWDNNPLQGLQYYRLKQTDFDGQFSYSELRPVYFGDNKTFEISNIYGTMESNGEFRIEFVYDSELPVDMTITDAKGSVIYKQAGMAAQPGINTINLQQQLPHGVYFVILKNADKMVNRKFFY